MEVPFVKPSETQSDIHLFLASGSPRRRELLHQIGVRFDVLRIAVEECHQAQESPEDYVLRLAKEKAQAGVLLSGQQKLGGEIPVLGADTIGVLDGNLLEKPTDEDDAVDMLMRMADRSHSVISGVALATTTRCLTAVCETRVQFGAVSESLARRYWQTGEPRDKSGAYGIQGKGAVFVDGIEGSYSNVVGLPLTETAALLKQFCVPVWTT